MSRSIIKRLLATTNKPRALLERLLPVCGNLRSAENELRWLDEHARHRLETGQMGESHGSILEDLVARRARHEPLQYILGTEYFGQLEIRCRPGVLIPRQETATSVSYLTRLLVKSKSLPPQVNVLDLCTGTGCIPLLMRHELYHNEDSDVPKFEGSAHFTGVDISPTAVDLSRENQGLQLASETIGSADGRLSLEQMDFQQADLFLEDAAFLQQRIDILISNPPYISPEDIKITTEKSVREFEPRLALVPTRPDSKGFITGDVFYPRLLEIAVRCRAKVVLFEVGDVDQARRVSRMALEQGRWDVVEIWRDEPWAEIEDEIENGQEKGDVMVRGRGNGRSVLLAREEGGQWVGSGQ